MLRFLLAFAVAGRDGRQMRTEQSIVEELSTEVDKPHRVWPGDPWDLLPESLEGAEIPAIMIAPQHLYDVRTAAIRELGFKPRHVMPVVTQEDCVYRSKPMTGVFFAHQNAWDAVLKSNTSSLILEADWTTAKRTAKQTRALMEKVLKENSNKDLISFGACDNVGAPMVCLTAYFLTPKAAQILLKWAPPCPSSMPVDDVVRDFCFNSKLKCFEAPHPPDLKDTSELGNGEQAFGEGIFQQDRTNLRGMEPASTKTPVAFHDTYDTPDAVS
jgi:hypothetical protein